MDLHEIKRKYFRINLEGNDAVSVRINKVPYEIFDLSDGGIGILLSPEDLLLAEGDELPIELNIEGTVQNLQGKVKHINPTGKEEYLCGIEFMNVEEKIRAKLMEFLQSCREKIFKEV
jgi:c-di-GMP-binding flagellar brake protein YcgR